MLTPSIISVVVFGLMLIEAARAGKNERSQRARGGVEPNGDVYRIMRIAYPAAFLLMIGEGWLRGAPRPAAVIAGAMVFALAKLVKWWAILSLGPHWTFRVIVVPGDGRVVSGPYRYVRHPNYIGVVGELLGVAAMTGAVLAGPLSLVAFAGLLARRIAVEERALAAMDVGAAASKSRENGRAIIRQ
jgi:methyltransferase